MNPLELQKWLKWTTNVWNIPKPNKMNKPPPKQRQNPRKQKWPKYYWILKNKQNTLESSENNQNTPKIKPKYTRFFRFLGYFGCSQVVSLIVEDFRAFYSFYQFWRLFFYHYKWMGHFGHFRGTEIWMLILAIFGVFWSFLWLSGYFTHFRDF